MGRRGGKAVQESSRGKTPVGRDSLHTEASGGRPWLRSPQAEEVFCDKTEGDGRVQEKL